MRTSFTIFGDPIGKPRMTQKVKWEQTDAQARYFAWADKARETVTGNPKQKLHANDYLGLYAFAHIGMPESWSAKKKKQCAGCLCTSKPDKDNIEKALIDALFEQDERICLGGLHAKFWCEEDSEPRIDLFLLALPKEDNALPPKESASC